MRRWTRNRLPSFGGTTTFWWKLKTSPRSRRRSQMLWWTSRCNNGLLFLLDKIENLIRFYSINVTQSCWRFRGRVGTTSTSSLEWTPTSFKIIISSRCSERTLCKSSISCLVRARWNIPSKRNFPSRGWCNQFNTFHQKTPAEMFCEGPRGRENMSNLIYNCQILANCSPVVRVCGTHKNIIVCSLNW